MINQMTHAQIVPRKPARTNAIVIDFIPFLLFSSILSKSYLIPVAMQRKQATYSKFTDLAKCQRKLDQHRALLLDGVSYFLLLLSMVVPMMLGR
jgi:hypothetical protein